MKLYGLLTAVLLVLLISSCEKDVLTQLPVERTDLSDIFNPKDKEGTLIEEYLAGVYAQLPTGFNRIGNNLLDAGTDDALSGNISVTAVDKFKTGQWGPSDLPENPWVACYSAIRRANILLANIGSSGIPDLRKDAIRFQARALRSIFYFELVKRWGGVPLLGDKVFGLEDDLQLARNSRAECVDYILSECEFLKDKLPATLTAGELGRISKGTIFALKSRLLLYEASPLYNPSNDLLKWQAAAKAADDLIKLNSYSLETNLSTLFTTRSNKEFILAYQQADNTTIESLNEPPGYKRGGQGQTNPTQNLVDAFPMANGKGIDEPGSGYSAADPYKNRDPRFYLTIFHNGYSWLGTPVETFTGGKNNTRIGIGTGTKTGYYMRKFMTTSGSATGFSNATHNFPIFRYAEILLNYAEAQNEQLAAPDASVYKAVNDIRKRAGITVLLTAGSLSKEQMRTMIRNERRIELAFEEHRFWDIRRWKIAETVLNGTLKGMKITMNPDKTLSYDPNMVVQTVTFDAARMYLYPVPYLEIQKNSALVQNQGWN
ncbi:RagB/SusD family nutrient uptake outer membrane protein [Pedobacter sp. KBW06]|uniref:RagB/SusD family nutrient uptake outer membrane protein n=1 Tax=Pedobacter sp. KBW06 TaxID=2153359 RepID=UPI000F5B7E03|nr:RagB/SusD family nutrient uptake outer membrane protein [Pedobacter sp. KBW06]RQO65248.1 RagB/SusD family nutrient uptake outer membrane protein [Pedobacter sp. KBW06]